MSGPPLPGGSPLSARAVADQTVTARCDMSPLESLDRTTPFRISPNLDSLIGRPIRKVLAVAVGSFDRRMVES